jgi:hypothetical protein
MPTTVIVIIAVVVVIVAGVLGYAATRPDSFTVQRSITVNAPAEKIYPLVADFRKWPLWSPYENKDPAMSRSYGGAPSGVGANYGWEGDRNVGAGRMEIIDAAAPTKIAIKLDFNRPFEAHNIAEFGFAPQGNATTVTWSMRGPLPFVGKVMQLCFNMDRMVGGDFETGLAKLKSVSEQ